MAASVYFQTVFDRAVAKTGEAEWLRLSIQDQSDAIYREFLVSDAERTAQDVTIVDQPASDTRKAA